MTDVGPEWIPDEDGVPSRQAARLVLFDSEGRVLLVKGHDTHDLDHQWWFTPGGGLAPGEEPLAGAVRETNEETDLQVNPALVAGPVAHRNAEFRFANITVRQEELFFLAWLDEPAPPLRHSGLTDLEKQTLDEFRWCTLDEVQDLARSETVYPNALPDLLRRWRAGWDGELLELGQDEPHPGS